MSPPERAPSVTAADVAAALDGRRSAAAWIARCPVEGHGRGRGDRTRSLSVGDAPDGKLLVHCHATCSQAAVIGALRERQLWPGKESEPSAVPRPSAVRPARPYPPGDELAGLWRNSERVDRTGIAT